MDVINQTVGDGLSDLLLVETVLHAYGWSIAEWDSAYTDLPNRQMKVCIWARYPAKHSFNASLLCHRSVSLTVISFRLQMRSVVAWILPACKLKSIQSWLDLTKVVPLLGNDFVNGIFLKYQAQFSLRTEFIF